MFEIRLSEQLFQDAQRRAAEDGFASVDDYVAEIVRGDLKEAEDFDHLFTPERMDQIRAGIAEVDAGRGMTPEQATAELARRRSEWLRQNQT